ncbi:MAG: OmpW family outer membrane protein [Pseudomonadales bacterium]|jgi:outer membrane protein
MIERISYALSALFLLFSPPAFAHEAGEWYVRAGLHTVAPQSKGDIVKVGNDTMVTFDVTYMVTENWAIGLLAAAPFKHELSLLDGTEVGVTKHLPPTLTAEYHFNTHGRFQPYVGVGLNVTLFFQEYLSGPLAGNTLTLDNSNGLSAVVGVDVALGNHWYASADFRWFDINTDAKVNGGDLGTVKIDPLGFGIRLGRKF